MPLLDTRVSGFGHMEQSGLLPPATNKTSKTKTRNARTRDPQSRKRERERNNNRANKLTGQRQVLHARPHVVPEFAPIVRCEQLQGLGARIPHWLQLGVHHSCTQKARFLVTMQVSAREREKEEKKGGWEKNGCVPGSARERKRERKKEKEKQMVV